MQRKLEGLILKCAAGPRGGLRLGAYLSGSLDVLQSDREYVYKQIVPFVSSKQRACNFARTQASPYPKHRLQSLSRVREVLLYKWYHCLRHTKTVCNDLTAIDSNHLDMRASFRVTYTPAFPSRDVKWIAELCEGATQVSFWTYAPYLSKLAAMIELSWSGSRLGGQSGMSTTSLTARVNKKEYGRCRSPG
jgi:hypothetical protein